MLEHLMNVKVKQGIIHINSIWQVLTHEDVIILEADCTQKYPEIQYYSGCSVGIGAGEHTLRVVDSTAVPTEITLDIAGKTPEERWSILAEASRYSITLVFFKDTGENKVIWQDLANSTS